MILYRVTVHVTNINYAFLHTKPRLERRQLTRTGILGETGFNAEVTFTGRS
jgi:hypothetical protein